MHCSFPHHITITVQIVAVLIEVFYKWKTKNRRKDGERTIEEVGETILAFRIEYSLKREIESRREQQLETSPQLSQQSSRNVGI